MTMKKILVVASVFASCVASAEWVTDMGSGWRLTVGSGMNFGADGKLGVKRSAMAVGPVVNTSSRNAAQAKGDAVSLGGGRTDFGNGAFVDPNDSAGVPGETWNWHVPAGKLDAGGRMRLEHAYQEKTSSVSYDGGVAKDDRSMYGADFAIERAVWKDGRFGVDVSAGFAFFLCDNWFKSSHGGWTRTDTTVDGKYLTDVQFNPDIVGDPWSQNPDGSYGAGSFAGPGPVLDLNAGDVAISHGWAQETVNTVTTRGGPFSIRGDLDIYQFQLALRPYYELTSWFMLRGTWGVGVDYRDFDVRVSGLGSQNADDWSVYMLCGIGGMFHWNDICLGCDFLTKVFDDDLDVDGRYVNGSIDCGDWSFKVYVGYSF